MSRIGLGRHGGIADESGDPLDGLVNLFDVGIVLAVAFLVAGLGLAVDTKTGQIVSRPTTTATPSGQQRTVPQTTPGAKATGHGSALGTLYRLDDGSLVVVEADGSRTPVAP